MSQNKKGRLSSYLSGSHPGFSAVGIQGKAVAQLLECSTWAAVEANTEHIH